LIDFKLKFTAGAAIKKHFKIKIMKTQKQQDLFEKCWMRFFTTLFSMVSLLSFVGGCCGATWHFYTAFLSALLAFIVYYATIATPSKNLLQ
jgi:hypothetical protein